MKHIFSLEFLKSLIEEPSYYVPLLLLALIVILPPLIGAYILVKAIYKAKINKSKIETRRLWIGIGLILIGVLFGLIPLH